MFNNVSDGLQEQYVKNLQNFSRSLTQLPSPLTRHTVKHAVNLLKSQLHDLNSFEYPEQNLQAANVTKVIWHMVDLLNMLPTDERFKYESLLLPWLNIMHFFLSRTLVKLHLDPSFISGLVLFFSFFIDPSLHPQYASLSTIPTKRDKAVIPKLSEEVKHAAVRCLSLTLPAQYKEGRYQNSFQFTPFAETLKKMKEKGDNFTEYTNVATLALLKVAQYEHDIQLRVDALRTLSQLLLDNVRNIDELSSIFPGTCSKLVAIIHQKPEKESHRIMCSTLETLEELITAVLSDEKNHTLVNIYSFSDLFDRNVPRNNKLDRPEAATSKQIRSTIWFKKMKEDLLPRLELVLRLRFYPDWRTRLAFVNFSVSLLKSCARSLDNCIRPLIEMLLLHIDDSYDQVANVCRLEMDLLSRTPCFADTMVPILKEELYDWMMKLAGYMIKRDEQEKVNAICLVTGLIILLREEAETTLAMALSRASDGWMTALQIDQDTLNVMEEKQQPDKLIESAQDALDNPTVSEPLYPKIRFKYAIHDTTVNKLTRLLNCIGKYCDLSSWISHFMRYLSDGLEECRDPQAVFIIHSLLAGACYFDPDTYDNLMTDEWMINNNGMNTIPTPAEKLRTITTQVYMDAMELLTQSGILNQGTASLTPATSQSVKFDIDSGHILATCFTLKLVGLTLFILGQSFVEDQLIHILYPLLSYLGSTHVYVHNYALITLESIASLCGARSVQDLAITNIDYIINSISQRVSVIGSNLRLPLVLKALIKVGGYPCIQYLEDTVEETFDVLEAYFDNDWLTSQLCGVLYEVILALQKHFTADSKEKIRSEGAVRLTEGQLESISKEISAFIEGQKEGGYCKDEAAKSLDEIGKYFLDRQQKGLHDGLTLEQSLRKQNIPFEDIVDENSDQENDMDMNEKTEDSQPLTHEQKMAKNIMMKASHFLTASSPQLRSQILGLLTAGTTVLSDNTQELNPLVYQMWRVIVNRFDDPQNYVVLNAAIFVEKLSEISTDFLSDKFANDLWPKFKQVVQKGVSAAMTDTSSTGYSIYSVYHRTQLSLLKTLTQVAHHVPMKQELVKEILEDTKFYYDKSNHTRVHSQLNEACQNLFCALATQQPDTVWLYETAYLEPEEYLAPPSALLDPFSIPAWIRFVNSSNTKKASPYRDGIPSSSLLKFK